MSLADLFMIMSFGAPLFISLISMVMMAAQRRMRGNTVKRKLLALITGYFLCVFISDTTVILFIFQSSYYIYSSSLSFFSLLVGVVFFYNIIYILTSENPAEQPSKLHYIIPVVLTVVHAVWCMFVPYAVQHDIVANRVFDLDNYMWFSLFYSSKLWVYAAYVVIYSILILRKMPAYHHHVNNYSADEERGSLRWLYLILILAFLIIPVSFITFFLNGRETVADEILAITANVLYILQLITLQYNMFTGNYILISEDCKSLNTENERLVNIDKDEFEKYIREKKPYLNPHLKITDILYQFHTCRSYMSSFINRTYGKNFSQYINNLRMQEYQKLKNDPDNSSQSDSELASLAGFNYRGFIRFKNKNKK